ncbi:hypothetical protein OUZ56_021674 [Daphnia magna]|uniref:Uncharacterized protein n=1 Tax=Daphnia magna TaxID=35525 RepID=A0ABR0AU73_9CRUS|nr:hypothetical protein OUZ56_021674 [Daphnia magna]
MDTQLQVGGCLVNMPCAKILLLGKLITANACLQACTIKEAGENKPIPSEIQGIPVCELFRSVMAE